MDTDNKLNIAIEIGADFALSFYITDDNDEIVDLTDARVEAQLREFAEAADHFDFTAAHNGSGGKVKINMSHVLTAQIPYTSGVWDVFIDFPDGTRDNPIFGDVIISPRATRPFDGTILQLIAIQNIDDLPTIGERNLLYYVLDDNVIYRWNGTNYVTAIDGNGIASIALHSQSGLVKVHRITLSDGSYYDFTVTDGANYDLTILQGAGIKMTIDPDAETATMAVDFPSTGTPEDLGTASNGTADTPARSDHVHEKPVYGNIQKSGALQTSDVTIGNGDKLVVTDADDDGKAARASLAFDASTTNQVLSKAGTWVNLPITAVTISDTDIEEGDPLAAGTLYLYYEP